MIPARRSIGAYPDERGAFAEIILTGKQLIPGGG